MFFVFVENFYKYLYGWVVIQNGAYFVKSKLQKQKSSILEW